MSNDNVNSHGRVGIARPTRGVDGLSTDERMTAFGELYTQPIGRTGRHALADEGAYFIAHSPTIDVATTTVGHAAPVLADADATMTKPLIHMIHSGATTSPVKIYLDYIRIEVIVAGANGTSDLGGAARYRRQPVLVRHRRDADHGQPEHAVHRVAAPGDEGRPVRLHRGDGTRASARSRDVQEHDRDRR